MGPIMKQPHSFRNTNPKHLDCGDLHDAETGEYLRPATADEASRSIRAQRFEGNFRGVISAGIGYEPMLCYVVQDRLSLDDWRLAIALKLRWEREQMRQWRNNQRRSSESDTQ